MKRLSIAGLAAVLVLPAAPAMADAEFWRKALSSAATTGTTYAISKDRRELVAAREDASVFVASGGEVRGPFLEAALKRLRADQPQLQDSDLQLATRLITEQ